MRRRVRITIRQDEITVHTGRDSRRAWCQACRAEREMVMVDDLPPTARVILESGSADSLALHHVRTEDGGSFICVESLMAWSAGDLRNIRQTRVAQIKERS